MGYRLLYQLTWAPAAHKSLCFDKSIGCHMSHHFDSDRYPSGVSELSWRCKRTLTQIKLWVEHAGGWSDLTAIYSCGISSCFFFRKAAHKSEGLPWAVESCHSKTFCYLEFPALFILCYRKLKGYGGGLCDPEKLVTLWTDHSIFLGGKNRILLDQLTNTPL